MFLAWWLLVSGSLLVVWVGLGEIGRALLRRAMRRDVRRRARYVADRRPQEGGGMSAADPYGRLDVERYAEGRYDGYSPEPPIVPTDETDSPEPADVEDVVLARVPSVERLRHLGAGAVDFLYAFTYLASACENSGAYTLADLALLAANLREALGEIAITARPSVAP